MGWLETEVVNRDVLIGDGMAGRGASFEATFWAKENGLRAAACSCGGATNIWRPHAVGEGGVFWGGHAIGPCVDDNWPTLG